MITDLTIIFITFSITKALTNSLKFDYKNWKSRFGIPDKWDWWFNPAISWNNKYFNWINKIFGWDENKQKWIGLALTPFSDAWHSLWTVWQISFVTYAIVSDGWISGLLITGIGGVGIVFNGLYAFMRRRELSLITVMKKIFNWS